MKKLMAFVSLLVIPALPVSADVITFRSGKTIEGTLTNQNLTQIVITVNGHDEVFPKKNIRAIRFSETKEEREKLEDLKKRSGDLNVLTMDVELKKAALFRLQKEIAELFRTQEERRKIADSLSAEFQKLLEKERTGPNALMRQAVLPGWGYYYLGNSVKAKSYSSLFVVSGLYTVAAMQEASAKKDAYSSSILQVAALSSLGVIHPLILHSVIAERKYRSYDRAVRKNNLAMNVLAGVYIASLAHLSFDNWFSRAMKDDAEGGIKTTLYLGSGLNDSSGERNDEIAFSLMFSF